MTTRTDATLAAVLSLLLVGSLVGLSSVNSVGATTQATLIDSCITINRPGVYELQGDVANADTDTCIEIQSDDVVLDGGGHLVDGVRTTIRADLSAGVEVTGVRNVTVRNLRLSDWDDGVVYENVSDAAVEGVTASDTDFGVFVSASREVTVTDSELTDSVSGVVFEGVSSSEITDTIARGNALAGFRLDGTRDVNLSGVTAAENGGLGAAMLRPDETSAGILLENATEVRVTGATVVGNVGGISLVNATDSVVAESSATSNEFGVRFERAEDSRVVGGTYWANEVGLEVVRSPGVNVSDVTAADNVVGVSLSTGGTAVVDSSVRRNDAAGVLLADARGNLFRNVTVGATTGTPRFEITGGVVLVNASDNRFVDVTLRASENWTVYDTGGGANFFSQVRIDGESDEEDTEAFSFIIRNAAFDVTSEARADDSVGGLSFRAIATGPDSLLSLSLEQAGVNESNQTETTRVA
ncbi:NosD domain-containing protein [Halorussus halophilus]|uniref:NosD domain-containing protein n=1 Tax=Halorussus halophilus TaxID=2650975 RepID=UPI001300D318|nr:right-handed parallel beta-helix repeat-containing protein [Halorussus halophilus]